MVKLSFDNWKSVEPQGAPEEPDKRHRITKKIIVEVQGNHSIINGETVEISLADVKFRITDENFFTEEMLSIPRLCLKKIEEEFGYGLGIHFPAIKATITGRLAQPEHVEGNEEDMTLVTCRFNRVMELDTFLKLDKLEEHDHDAAGKKSSFKAAREPDAEKPKPNPFSSGVNTGPGSGAAAKGSIPPPKTLAPDKGGAELNTFFSGMKSESGKGAAAVQSPPPKTLAPEKGGAELNDFFSGMHTEPAMPKKEGPDLMDGMKSVPSVEKKAVEKSSETDAPDPGKRDTKEEAPKDTVQVRTTHKVEVFSDYNTYQAQAFNYSSSGVLIEIIDSEFGLPNGPEKAVQINQIVSSQFAKGLTVRFPDGNFSIQAEANCVREIISEGKQHTVIDCKVIKTLTPEESEQVKREVKSVPTDPAPAQEPVPETVSEPVQETVPEPVQEPAQEPAQKPAQEMESPKPGGGEPRDMPKKESGIKPAGFPSEVDFTNIFELMKLAVERKATDLHIKVGSPPRMRVSGTLLNVGDEPVTPELSQSMARDLMPPEKSTEFTQEMDVELAHSVEGAGRFRVNIFRQQEYTGLAIRCIPSDIPTIESLGLHPLAQTLAEKPRGLVLVTGPAGSGKSTTLAAMVDHINRTRSCHVITLENPIEYKHQDMVAQITQREIGNDVLDINRAIGRALRQDPDVLMVGEMRNLETIAHTLNAAESGRLVFAMLHTSSAAQAPTRIIDVFPPERQTQIRLQLADTLQGIMAQILVPREDGEGMVLAQEILVVNDTVRDLIRENKTAKIASVMQTGGNEGMQSLEASLNRLVQDRVISYVSAVAKANIPAQIRRTAVS